MFARLGLTSLLAIALASPTLVSCQKDKGDKKKKDDGNASGSAVTSTAGAGKTAAGHGRNIKKPKVEVPPPADVAAPPADAKRTASGLAYKVLKAATTAEGAGVRPGVNDKVTVNYTGWTTDGKMFDTSKKRRSPATFGVGKVIPGWTEGLQLMQTGESFRFWIPEELAYKGKSGPQGMLVFDVELLEVTAAPKPPDDVAAPPKDAKKTKLGVFYKVLTAGNAGKKPRSWDKVKVHYSGWTTDGKMFDSSVMRGSPATFGVSGVIAGWTDALQVMQTGDKWRVWIPEPLAYKGQPGRPAGMLVFDVELLEVIEMPEPPKAPADVKAPPKGVKKTASGVSYKILKEGNGPKPTVANKVKVHYTGWTTDGKMFDSSITRKAPATFGLGRVIPGWRDGLLELKVGSKARMWIPEELAYKGKPGAPQGMLVFDVELLEIVTAKPAPPRMPKPAPKPHQ